MIAKPFTEDELIEYTLHYEQDEMILEKIKYFASNRWGRYIQDEKNIFFCLIMSNKQIVGVTKLRTGKSESAYNPGYSNWIDFCSIHPDFQGKGYSYLMLVEMFNYIKENNIKKLLSSSYTQLGYDRIRKNLIKLSKTFKIDFKDKNEVSF